jgi:hypothetical protein
MPGDGSLIAIRSKEVGKYQLPPPPCHSARWVLSDRHHVPTEPTFFLEIETLRDDCCYHTGMFDN